MRGPRRWYYGNMKIIAISRDMPDGPEASSAMLRDEAATVWRLQTQGVIRQIWFTTDTHDAVIEMECSDAGEAARALAELPLVAARVIRFDLLPLRAYDGFTRLFAS